jgi:orotidine-5'-phosphate decarboxylase
MTEIIAALDVDTIKQEEELLEKLKGTVSFYKIGMRLFTAHGKRAIDLVLKDGGKVFLDLKLLDIPETVSQTVRQAQRLGVHAVSFHLWGGADMLKAAAAVQPRPKLWGVTVLTSFAPEDLKLVWPNATLGPMITRLARLGKAHHADGIICSAADVPALQKTLGPDTTFITPGIRPSNSPADDQSRVATPAEAARLGIRYVVVGRPITKAPDPLRAAQEIAKEMTLAAPAKEKIS